ncbi:MAG: thioredoxin family protein [Gammaproteobacteria bacterium]|nr:thioredoxin family protein [Gammaproteobacteria bacterium]
MNSNKVVTPKEWLAARKELLAKEKEFSRLRDELTAARQALPWEKVEKEYRFHGPQGEETLADLFDGRSQLIIYHFMFDPEWNEGCKSCSFVADHYEPSIVHLVHRDVTLVTVSRAPLEKLDAFKQRMGWDFKWVSSLGSDFNRDLDVTFTQEEIEQNKAFYNYQEGATFPVSEAPGISVFRKDTDNAIYHTYSAYSRGLENFIGAYTLLDIVPKGRDEDSLAYGMEWLRHKDRYDDPSFVDPYI